MESGGHSERKIIALAQSQALREVRGGEWGAQRAQDHRLGAVAGPP